MENKNLRNVLMAAGLAVFAGVLTLGVNAAFGLDVPSQDPAGAALHSPVFDGVDIQGPIQNSSDKNFGILNIQDNTVINGDLGISGSVSANKNVTVGFVNNPPGATNGILEVINKIINPVLNQPVKIDDDLDVQGSIKNSIVEKQGVSDVPLPITVDDDLVITKNLAVYENAFVIKGLTVGGVASVSGALTVGKDQLLTVDKITSSSPGTQKAIIFNTPIKGMPDLSITDRLLVKGTAANSEGEVWADAGIWSKDYLRVDGDVQLGNITGLDDQPNPVINSESGILRIRDGNGGGPAPSNEKYVDIGGGTLDSTITPFTILPDLAVNGLTQLKGGAWVPNGQSLVVLGDLGVGVTGKLELPSANGQIKNTNGNPILQTWWNNSPNFGDYTALNSGYAWTGDDIHPNEPVSVVAGANGVYFMKGLNGAAYQTQIGKIDLAGNLNLLGTYAKAVGGTNRAVYVDSSGNIGTIASSKRFKENIKDMEDTSWLYRLRPVNFIYKNDGNKEKQYGLIAEEVEKVNSSLVTYDESGKVYSVLYQNLFGPMIKALQEQKKENAEIKKALCEIKPELEICKSL